MAEQTPARNGETPEVGSRALLPPPRQRPLLGWAALALVIDCHTREFATLRQGHNCRQWTCLGFVPVF